LPLCLFSHVNDLVFFSGMFQLKTEFLHLEKPSFQMPKTYHQLPHQLEEELRKIFNPTSSMDPVSVQIQQLAAPLITADYRIIPIQCRDHIRYLVTDVNNLNYVVVMDLGGNGTCNCPSKYFCHHILACRFRSRAQSDLNIPRYAKLPKPSSHGAEKRKLPATLGNLTKRSRLERTNGKRKNAEEAEEDDEDFYLPEPQDVLFFTLSNQPLGLPPPPADHTGPVCVPPPPLGRCIPDPTVTRGFAEAVKLPNTDPPLVLLNPSALPTGASFPLLHSRLPSVPDFSADLSMPWNPIKPSTPSGTLPQDQDSKNSFSDDSRHGDMSYMNVTPIFAKHIFSSEDEMDSNTELEVNKERTFETKEPGLVVIHRKKGDTPPSVRRSEAPAGANQERPSRPIRVNMETRRLEVINSRLVLANDLDLPLEIGTIPGKGRGVFSKQQFQKGDFVVEYAGDLLTDFEARKRELDYQKDPSKGSYMFYFTKDNQTYCIDATEESGRLGRLINHSKKKPNLKPRVHLFNNRPYIILIASRTIQKTEELLFDYGDRSKISVADHPWLLE